MNNYTNQDLNELNQYTRNIIESIEKQKINENEYGDINVSSYSDTETIIDCKIRDPQLRCAIHNVSAFIKNGNIFTEILDNYCNDEYVYNRNKASTEYLQKKQDILINAISEIIGYKLKFEG